MQNLSSHSLNKGGCKTVPARVEIVATAGQTSFTLPVAPESGVVETTRNGIEVPILAFTASGTTATYDPAENGGQVLLAGDRIIFDYIWLDCGVSPEPDQLTDAFGDPLGGLAVVTPNNLGSDFETDPTDVAEPFTYRVKRWVQRLQPSALTDADWGLGRVIDPINTAALLKAELEDAAADNAAVSADALTHVLGNTSVEGLINGLVATRNPDGSMGAYSVGAATEDGALDAHFAALNIEVANGTTAVSDGRYDGQLLILQFGGLGEQVLTGKFRGVLRNSQHRIASNTIITSIIVRPTEVLILRWGGDRWLAVSTSFFMNRWTSWRENLDGTVTMWRANGPSGVNFLSLALVNTDYAITGSGSVTFSAKTATSVTLSAAGDWQLEGGRADYAALGGIASF